MNAKKSVMPLTDEQRKFAEEHAGLIWRFIRRHNLGFGDPELQNDWYGEMAEAYLVAVAKYRPEVGPFSNFANGCMYLHMKRCLSFQNRQMRSKMIAVSMNAPIKDGSEMTLEDCLHAEYCSTEDTAVNRVHVSEILSQIWPLFTDKHREALLAKAFYQEDWRGAAASIGIKPLAYKQRIHYARRRIKEKVPLELQFQQDA